LTQELYQHDVEGPGVIFERLERQQRIGFRDIGTGNESWIYLDTNPNSVSIGTEGKAFMRLPTAISSIKPMVPVFQGIRGMIPISGLSMRAFERVCSNENILPPMAAEAQGEERGVHRLWTPVHMDHAKSHTSK
jgi:hypothetical protein